MRERRCSSMASNSSGNSWKPLAQRRDQDRVGAEPVIKIVTEQFFPAQFVERFIRRGDDPSAKSQFLVTAHGRERPLLQDLEELDLDRHRDIADLVEENRPMRTAERERAFVGFDRAGERAFLVAEQFGFDQRLGKLGEVQRNEILGKTFRETVFLFIERNKAGSPDGSGGRAFAGSRFVRATRWKNPPCDSRDSGRSGECPR